MFSEYNHIFKLINNEDIIEKENDIHLNQELIINKIKRLGLSNFLYKKIKKNNLFINEIHFFKKSYIRVYFDNEKKKKIYCEISNILNKEKIEFIPLKGFYIIEHLYNDYGQRHISDIDILIKENQLDRITRLMIENNYSIKQEFYKTEYIKNIIGSPHPITFIKNNVAIEIHTHLHSKISTFKIDVQDYWKRAINENLISIPTKQLCKTDFLQYLCIHLYKHVMIEKSISLKHFIDIYKFLNIYSNEVNWNQLTKNNKLYNCANEVNGILYLCCKYFNCKIGYDINFLDKKMLDFDVTFIKLLKHDGKIKTSNISTRIKEIKNISGIFSKIKYLVDNTFPDKKFLAFKYNCNENQSYFTLINYRLSKLILKK